MTNKINTSNTSIAADAPIAVYSGSKENLDLLASQKKVYPGNVVGAVYVASTELGTEDIDFELDLAEGDQASTIAEEDIASNLLSAVYAPSISDVSVVSNEVVYDAAGNPSITVVLKVKNSSGQTLKGINARIQALW